MTITKSLTKSPLCTPLADGRMMHYDKMLVMGIINATPDSFYGFSRSTTLNAGLAKAESMLADGADILDIGGESTRPGSRRMTSGEEIQRVIPLITAIKKAFPQSIISIDTYHADTAEKAIAVGADIINDISALMFDERMATVAAQTKAPIILMHMQGTPQTMQAQPVYDDVMQHLQGFFHERIDYALTQGIERCQIILDPGIGFGKTDAHNLTIMHHLQQLTSFDLPILLAASRKSTIGNVLGKLAPEDRLEGTLATTAQAIFSGAHCVRVHDVLENIRFIRMMEAIRQCH